MVPCADIAAAAALIGEPARAAILAALLDGSARPAGELAYAAGVSAQTASAHLAKLLEGGLLAMQPQGRHRYYRLAGPPVAALLEQLSTIGPPRRRPLGRQAEALRHGRRCYDHLAGQLGVALADGMLARDLLRPADARRFAVTPAGAAWFAAIGLDPTLAAHQCLDWTERRPHLGGPLGVQLLRRMEQSGWLRRARDSRAVTLTRPGSAWLADQFGTGLAAAA